MQSKNAIAIVYVMAGMCSMYKLCVLFGMETLKWSMLCVLNTYVHGGCGIHVAPLEIRLIEGR